MMGFTCYFFWFLSTLWKLKKGAYGVCHALLGPWRNYEVPGRTMKWGVETTYRVPGKKLTMRKKIKKRVKEDGVNKIIRPYIIIEKGSDNIIKLLTCNFHN